MRYREYALAPLVVLALSGCGDLVFGGPDGFERPPLTLTQADRCLWYKARIPALEAKDSLSTLQSAALTFYRTGEAAACAEPVE